MAAPGAPRTAQPWVVMGDRETEYQTIVLAALLHDIGKLLQRGQGLALDYASHPHHSAQFVASVAQSVSGVADTGLLETLVQHHHEDRRMPAEMLVQSVQDLHTRMLATLVSTADNLSSSERGDRGSKAGDFRTVPLACVFQQLFRWEQDGQRKTQFLRYHARPLGDVDSLESIFPQEFTALESTEITRLIDGRDSLGAAFRAVFASDGSKAQPQSDFRTVLAHLDALLRRYCWCVPADTQADVPDVSLYDHMHTTCAIASCLYRYHGATGTLNEQSIRKSDNERFLLLVGDLSGIQDYIFDIASIGVGGGVARRLRARSLFVQLCSEISVDLLLEAMALPRSAHLLMVAGGKFYLLLPNLPQYVTAIETVQREVDRWFLSKLNGELALNLAWTPFGDDGFSTGSGTNPEAGFGTVLGRLASALEIAKRHRHAPSLIHDKGWNNDAFVIGTDFEGLGPCQSCHKFPAVSEGLCEHCGADAVAGGLLPRTRYLSFLPERGVGHFSFLDRSVELSDSPPSRSSRPYRAVLLNEADLSSFATLPGESKYFARYAAPPDGCSICAEERTHVASFECLSKRSRGKAMLGLLKVDADSLGETFIFGLKGESISLDTVSRIATMSRMLDVFFTGWVERRARTNGNVYTVYSGGDDLLLLGAWDSVLRLAGELRQDYRQFTGTSRLTLSAGVLFTRPDYPIARAAPAVDEALESAKEAGRDRIVILGRTLTWAEWDEIERLWLQLREEVRDIPSAFLRRLLSLSQLWQRYEDSGDTTGLSFYPLLAYSIARNLGTVRSATFRTWVEDLINLRPSDATQKATRKHLGLLARLLILSKQEGSNERQT